MESSQEEVAVTSYSNSSTGPISENSYYAAAGFTKRKRASPSPPPPLPPGNIEENSTTEEEEDTANCLILLAQGRRTKSSSPSEAAEKFTSRKLAETITTAPGAKAGFYVYECKTCNKCFPSFQALGGHRASHKKPKLGPTNSETTTTHVDDVKDYNSTDGRTNTLARSSPPAAAAGNRLRVHECSICGSEFASGQALGGHMRRHRPVGPTSVVAAPRITEEKKSMLSLDLNLPAPSEEINMGFAFADRRPMALVDCHY